MAYSTPQALNLVLMLMKGTSLLWEGGVGGILGIAETAPASMLKSDLGGAQGCEASAITPVLSLWPKGVSIKRCILILVEIL